MAQNITIAGNQYPSVPSVLIPKTGGGGNAVFADPSPVTASAADVLAGKYFLDSTGSITEGTGSGGGGNEDAIIDRTISGTYYNSTVSQINTYAFAYCKNLISVEFTAATVAGNSAFLSCTSLTTAIFPLVTVASTATFSGNTALSTAIFPNLTNCGNSTFNNCRALETVSVPLLQNVGSTAFRNCQTLRSISLPALSAIYSSAFAGCSSLESVYLFNSVVASASTSNIFATTPLSASSYLGYFGSIYVRSSLLASWKAAANWSLYSARMVGLTDAQIEALG